MQNPRPPTKAELDLLDDRVPGAGARRVEQYMADRVAFSVYIREKGIEDLRKEKRNNTYNYTRLFSGTFLSAAAFIVAAYAIQTKPDFNGIGYMLGSIGLIAGVLLGQGKFPKIGKGRGSNQDGALPPPDSNQAP